MKKLVLASAMAIASLSLVWTPALGAQAPSGQINLPAPEFNAYQTATTETNPTAKAQALEEFLKTYPQSPVKKEVLDQLMDTYRQLNDLDKELSACNRLLQIDPNDMKAILYSVMIKKSQCAKTVNGTTGISSDPQTCDDAAALAQKGLTLSKPANVSDDDWKSETGFAYPEFHSAIALDDAASKKDFNAAIKEYRQALMLYSPQATESGTGLTDTFQLAQAYTKPDSRDLPKAVWFYARVWNFAPPSYKAQFEQLLEYWYKRYHGKLDGLDAVKTAAKATVFPPSDFKLAAAPTPPEIVHNVITSTPDLTKLNLEDKEYILANGNAEDQQKLWSVLQGQPTPVPGIVTGVTSTGMTVHITVGTRIVHDYTVALKNPMAAKDIRAVPDDVQQKKQFIDQNGVADDVAKVDHEFTLAGDRIRKIELEPNASTIDMAVTQDAKDNNKADFIVNLKKPLEGKDVPAPGFEYKLLPNGSELDATYSSYKPVPAEGTHAASAQIVLSDGFVQTPQAKKPTPARRAPAHRPAVH